MLTFYINLFHIFHYNIFTWLYINICMHWSSYGLSR